MKLKLDLKNNALNSIYQGLIHFDNGTNMEYEFRDKDSEFHHDDQSVTYRKDGKISFYVEELFYIPPRYYELKFSIVQFIHGIELLLLDIIRSHNKTDIYSNTQQTKTINFWFAIKKIQSINPELLTTEQIDSLKICKELRNNFEHFETESTYEELYKVCVQLISILNGIFQIHLNVLIPNFFSFDCWADTFHDKFRYCISSALLDLKKLGYDFNYQLIKNKKNLISCIYCEVKSYDENENLCLLCLNEIDIEIRNMI